MINEESVQEDIDSGFSKEQMDELLEQEEQLREKVKDVLSNLPEYKQLIYVQEMIKNETAKKEPYKTVVEKIDLKEQRKIIAEALRDIALENLEYCTSYKGDEEKYLEFVNRIHGFKDEWKAFRRTNVDNFNYYLAKAKFMLDNFAYDYCVLLVDEFKDYERLLNSVEREKFLNGIGQQVIIERELYKKIKNKTKRDIKIKQYREQIYKRQRYRNIGFEEFCFRLESVRILSNASQIPELKEFAPLIHYKYFCDASVIETSRMIYDLDDMMKLASKNNWNIEETQEKLSLKEYYNIVDDYYKDTKHRGSVNNELRKLEKALANYLISREKDLISGFEYYEKYKEANKSLDEKDLLIEFAKTMKTYKETAESLKNMTIKNNNKSKKQ